MKMYHSLLKRQIQKIFGSNVEVNEDLQNFFELINETYYRFDEDRKLLERSLEISSEKRLESNTYLRDMSKNLEKQKEILLYLATNKHIVSGDSEEAFKEITEVGSKVLNTDRCSIWLHNKNRDTLVCADLYEKNKNAHSKGMIRLAKEYSGYFSLIEKERLIVSNNTFTYFPINDLTNNYFIPFNIKSLLDAPIRMEGNTMEFYAMNNAKNSTIGFPRSKVLPDLFLILYL